MVTLLNLQYRKNFFKKNSFIDLSKLDMGSYVEIGYLSWFSKDDFKSFSSNFRIFRGFVLKKTKSRLKLVNFIDGILVIRSFSLKGEHLYCINILEI